MSSTNRSEARQAHIADYYVTPQWAIRDFLAAFNQDWRAVSGAGVDLTLPVDILDPCAGGDATHAMAYPVALMEYSTWKLHTIDTLDIRRDSKAAQVADYLEAGLTFARQYDIIITNPPFNSAMAIIQKALQHVRPHGLVIMLLRLNFFGSQDRKAWFQKHMPLLTYVHSQRMNFVDKGTLNPKTGKPLTGDSIEYCHMVWQAGTSCRFTNLRVI